MFGRYFEDFKEGQVIEHFPRKTITESDNNLFSLLTMNHHPIHLDNEYAKKHPNCFRNICNQTAHYSGTTLIANT
jgi:acyl dehydratase